MPFVFMGLFWGDKAFYTADAGARLYSPLAYFLAKLTAALPLNGAVALSFFLTFYGMAGLRHGAAFVARGALIGALLALTATQVEGRGLHQGLASLWRVQQENNNHNTTINGTPTQFQRRNSNNTIPTTQHRPSTSARPSRRRRTPPLRSRSRGPRSTSWRAATCSASPPTRCAASRGCATCRVSLFLLESGAFLSDAGEGLKRSAGDGVCECVRARAADAASRN